MMNALGCRRIGRRVLVALAPSGARAGSAAGGGYGG
jgi:hypothetical protein